jgi:hypothetical protein
MGDTQWAAESLEGELTVAWSFGLLMSGKSHAVLNLRNFMGTLMD